MHVNPIFRFLGLCRRHLGALAVKLVRATAALAGTAQTVYRDKMPEPVQRRIATVHENWQAGKLPRLWKGQENETAFYPAALEIAEQPPSPAAHVVVLIVTGFFLVALLWSCIGTVDIIATAQGKIVPTGRTKVIQPLEAGVVRSIKAQDGQAVKAGDTLIEIDSTITESERNRLQKEYVQAELDAARLRAALQINVDPAVSFLPPKEASEQQIATQKNLLQNQLSEIKAKLEGLDQQIAQAKGNQASVQSTIRKINESLPFLKQRAAARQTLANEGYGSKLDNLTAQQDLSEHENDVQVQKGKLAEVTASISSLERQREEAAAGYQHDNLEELRDAEDKSTSLHEQLIQAAQKFRLQTLTAPVDGTVQQLAIHTEGGVVTPAQTLLSIVPSDSHMEIEAMVSNRDIGFVHAGQPAAIKIDTFNFTRYGLLEGKVVSVSQDAITRDKPAENNKEKKEVGAENDTSEPNGQELVYQARVSLKQSQMDIDGQMVNLSPGMAATVEIKTGSRHVISYLLSPIKKHVSQALRER